MKENKCKHCVAKPGGIIQVTNNNTCIECGRGIGGTDMFMKENNTSDWEKKYVRDFKTCILCSFFSKIYNGTSKLCESCYTNRTTIVCLKSIADKNTHSAYNRGREEVIGIIEKEVKAASNYKILETNYEIKQTEYNLGYLRGLQQVLFLSLKK